MNKFKNIKFIGIAIVLLFTACEDFLDRPSEDSYTIDSFYQTNEQCIQAVNLLYSSPWHDYHRGFYKIGDGLAGNHYMGTDNVYVTLTPSSADEDLIGASNSLWLVNGHANAIIENIATKAGANVDQVVKDQVTGEAMVWKSMAYFYLARTWGAVPIIHSNSDVVGAGNATSLKKNRLEDVYEYIVRTLTAAAEMLPTDGASGRIDKMTAYGLLAKVYLTRSGLNQSGSRNTDDLAKAADYAEMVYTHYAGWLEPNYRNLFRISTGNFNEENLLSWRWTVTEIWTASSFLQAEMAPGANFTADGAAWGQYGGPTIELQSLYNDNATSKTRNDDDQRRRATVMMYNDFYPYFWRQVGGFTATFDNEDNVAGAEFLSPTGAQCVKHIVGHFEYDHGDETGGVFGQAMKTSLATHLLRLADVYLILAEARLGNDASTSDALALEAYNAVKSRAIATWTDATSVTFEEIFNERRRELAYEGDNWFDYVRLSYYKPQEAMAKINSQERGYYTLDEVKEVYKDQRDPSDVTFESFKLNITSESKFTIPFPVNDLTMNPNLRSDVEPVEYDFSQLDY